MGFTQKMEYPRTYSDVHPCLFIDAIHVFMEFWAMSIMILINNNDVNIN